MALTARWIGWFVALCAVMAYSCVTTIACWNFGKFSLLFSADPDRNALIFAGMDIAKMFLPIASIAIWRANQRAAGIAASIAFLVFLGASLFAAFGVAAISSASKEASTTIAASRLAGLQKQLERLKPELSALGTPRPVEQITADIARHKISDKWSASGGCDDRRIIAGTLDYCRTYQKLFAELAGANRAKELRHDITAVEVQIAASTTTESVMAANPATAALAKFLNVDASTINATWSIVLAIALEAISAFMPSAILALHPPFPAAPAMITQRSVKVASASRKISPHPKPAKRNSVPLGTGRRGRPRDAGVYDFVRAFTERHGRAPTFPEAREEIGDVAKTTFYRARDVIAGCRERKLPKMAIG